MDRGRAFAAVVGLALLWMPQLSVRAADDDWQDKPWQEDVVTLPAPFQAEALVELVLDAAAANRVFVDPHSISIGADRVVRYTLVTRTAGGATNIAYEGIRCLTRELRTYAIGRPDGSWRMNPAGRWTDLPRGGRYSPYGVLTRDYFCPDGIAVQNTDTAVRVLRAGGRRPAY